METSEETSFAFMIFNELNTTRKKLLTEEDKKVRKSLNSHFRNIVKLSEDNKQKVKNEEENRRINL